MSTQIRLIRPLVPSNPPVLFAGREECFLNTYLTYLPNLGLESERTSDAPPLVHVNATPRETGPGAAWFSMVLASSGVWVP